MMKRKNFFSVVLVFIIFVSLNYFMSANYFQSAFALSDSQIDEIEQSAINDKFNVEFGIIKISNDDFAFLIMYLDERGEARFLKQDSVVSYDFFHLKILDLRADEERNETLDISIVGYKRILYNQTTGERIGYEEQKDYSVEVTVDHSIVSLNIELESTKETELIRLEYKDVWFIFRHRTLKEYAPVSYTLINLTQQKIIFGIISLSEFSVFLVFGWLIARKAKKVEISDLVIYTSLVAFGMFLLGFALIVRLYLWSQIVYYSVMPILAVVMGMKLYTKEFPKIIFWSMDIQTNAHTTTRMIKQYSYEYYEVVHAGTVQRCVVLSGLKYSVERFFNRHTYLVVDNQANTTYLQLLNKDKLHQYDYIPIDRIVVRPHYEDELYTFDEKGEIQKVELKEKKRRKLKSREIRVYTTSQARLDSREFSHRLIHIVNTEKKLKAVEDALSRVLASDVANDYERMSRQTEEVLNYIGLVYWMKGGDVSDIPESIRKEMKLSQDQIDSYAEDYYQKVKGVPYESDKKKTR